MLFLETSGSGRVSRLLDGSSLTCERELAGIARPRGGRSRSGAKAKRIAWWERRGSGGMREQEASRRSGVQLAAAICASMRRGQREWNGKGEGWTLCVVVSKGGVE